MSDEWNSEAGAKQSGVPKWAWWVGGCGCAAFLAVAVMGFFGFRLIKGMTDAEANWPKVQEALPFEGERPEGIDFTMAIPMGGLHQYHMTAPGMQVVLSTFTEAQVEAYEQMLDPDFEGAAFGMGALVGPEAATVNVQGRDVHAVRFERRKPEPAVLGRGIVIDLADETHGLRIVELRLLSGSEPVSAEQIDAFFAPFQVWG